MSVQVDISMNKFGYPIDFSYIQVYELQDILTNYTQRTNR